MTEALLAMGAACMLNFAGGIPKPYMDQTWSLVGGERLVQQLDERYISEEVRIYGGNLAIGAQVLFQQKLILRTEF